MTRPAIQSQSLQMGGRQSQVRIGRLWRISFNRGEVPEAEEHSAASEESLPLIYLLNNRVARPIMEASGEVEGAIATFEPQ